MTALIFLMDFTERFFTFTEVAAANWFVVMSKLFDYSAYCLSIDSIKSKEVVE